MNIKYCNFKWKNYSGFLDSPLLTEKINNYFENLMITHIASNNSKYLLKQIVNDFANESHPYHNITNGNYLSLINKKFYNKKNEFEKIKFLLRDVKSYFDTFYKTKNMSLILYSNRTIQDMEKILEKFAFDSHNSLDVEAFLFQERIDSLKDSPYHFLI